jgi:hypothetical protein
MTKLLISIWILIIGFITGLLLGLSTPDSIKDQWAHTIKKDMQTRKKEFHVGDVKFSPTKYKGLWLAETKTSYAGIGGEGRRVESEEK